MGSKWCDHFGSIFFEYPKIFYGKINKSIRIVKGKTMMKQSSPQN